MKFSGVGEIISQYARAELYAISSIRRLSDLHLVWGPVRARLMFGLGARNFSLYRLAECPRESWSDYLINEPLKARYAAITSKEARLLADDKIRFFEHCKQHGISTVDIRTLITTQPSTSGNVSRSTSAADLARALVPGEYFVKPSNGSHGEGAFSLIVGPSGLQWGRARGSVDDFFRHCVAGLKHAKSLIVQPKLSNHHEIRSLTQAKGLSTIRVVTIRNGGDIKVIAACLRIVVGDSEVDNFSHGAIGNLVAAVDVDDGVLISSIGSSSKRWPRIVNFPSHPSSGMPIVGVQLPFWAELIALVKTAHHSIDGLRTVGWDVAITDNGPLVVEANWRYDIDILQVGYKKGFRRIIDDLLT